MCMQSYKCMCSIVVMLRSPLTTMKPSMCTQPNYFAKKYVESFKVYYYITKRTSIVNNYEELIKLSQS